MIIRSPICKITLWCRGEIKEDTLRRDAMAHHQATTNSSIHFVLCHTLSSLLIGSQISGQTNTKQWPHIFPLILL